MPLLHLVRKYNAIIFAVFLAASLIVYLQYFAKITFPDEFENFANTWLVTKGLIVYRDFFSNHLPSLIFLGIPAEIVNHSKLSYRVEVLIFYFSTFASLFFYLKGYLKYSILPFMLFSAYAISLFGGQQFADGPLWALTLISAFFIIAKNQGSYLSKNEIVVFSLLMFVCVMSSPMHILGFIMLMAFYLLTQSKGKNRLQKNLSAALTLGVSLAIPALLFLAYLLLTKSLNDFYQATVYYNQKYYYLRLYPHPYISFHLIDYYLHTSRDVINNVYEILKYQTPLLLNFLRSLKSILFHPNLLSNKNYLAITFSTFWDHFFTFEVLILFFYILGFLALFKPNKALAIFSLIFVFGIRVRINERIHMSPYYLFSYWMIAAAATITAENILKKRSRTINIFFMALIAATVLIFIAKNDSDFKQIVYNNSTDSFTQTASYLLPVNKNQKIMVMAPVSGAYFWESQHLPGGYFINYYDFFAWSPQLHQKWLSQIQSYKGNYFIVSPQIYSEPIIPGQNTWVAETKAIIQKNYVQEPAPIPDLVFRKINAKN